MLSMFSRHTNKRNGGFSLLELFASITLLMAGLIAFGGVFLSTARMTDRNRENNLVTITLHNVVETLDAADFETLVTAYGAGSANEYFWCEGDGALLFADPGGAEIAGRLYFYNDEQNMPTNLADLSVDGDINADLVTNIPPVTDYVILPVRIELTVVNASPPRVVTVDLILTGIPAAFPAPIVGMHAYFQQLANNNPGPLGDKAEDVRAQIQTALDELAKSPPDTVAAASNLSGAQNDLQAMIDSALIDPVIGQQLMDEISTFISQL